MNIKDFVYTTSLCHFNRYFDGSLYYRVRLVGTNDWYEFEIPIADTTGATFDRDIKALLLMRWIRKAIENKTLKLVS